MKGLPQGYTRLRAQGRKMHNGKYSGYLLTVPAWMGRRIGTEQVFEILLTDEGIVFKPVEEHVGLPDWVKEGDVEEEDE